MTTDFLAHTGPAQPACATTRVRGVKRITVHRQNCTYRYYYHRSTRKRIMAEFESPEFFLEITQLDAMRHEGMRTGISLTSLIGAYRTSREFPLLAPQTQCNYEKAFSWLQQSCDRPLAAMTHDLPYRLRDKACRQHNARFANIVLQAMRALLSWGRSHADGTCRMGAAI